MLFLVSVLNAQMSLSDLVDEGERYIGENPTKVDSIATLLEQLASENNDVYYLSIAFSFDGISSAMMGDLGPSLQSFQESWKLAVTINDTNLQINALTNMAGVYRFAGQPTKAMVKLGKALELLEGDEHKQTRANTLLAIGIIQEELEDFLNASKSYKAAIKVFDETGNMSSYLSCVEKLGSLLTRVGKLDEAYALYSFSLEGRSVSDQVGMTIPLFREKGVVLFKQGKYSLASENLRQSLALSDSLNYKLLQDSTLVMLIRVSSKMKDFESVNRYTNRLVQYHQEQDSKKVEETLASLEIEYELNEQKLLNRALAAESEKANLQVEYDRNILIGMFSVIVLLVIIAIIALALIRRIQKFNSELELKVQEKTDEVLLRDQQIKATAFKLAHELRSGVATLLGAKNLLDENGIPEGIDKELYEAIGHSTEKLDVTIKEMIKNLEKITYKKEEE
jgi:tetratricopeptide (TPR) repeat protein